MKKTNFAKILTIVLVCAALIGAVVGINASAASDEKSIEIVSNNVWYGETLQLVYAVKCDSDVVVTIYSDEDCTVEWSKTAPIDVENTTINGVENCKVYGALKGVPVQNINTNLWAKAVDTVTGDEVVQRYSVLEYLFERLNVSENVEENQIAMYEAHLAYALAAEDVLYDNPPSGTAKARPEGTNPVAGYYYVKVTNGTIDGTYSAGMYEKGVKPFNTSIAEATPDAKPAEGNYELKWQIGGSVYTDDELSNVEVGESNIIVTATWVEVVSAGTKVTATLTFDDTAKRTEFSTTAQVWVENGITFQNVKSSSTSNVADYSKPVRLYKSSDVVISVDGTISTIAIACNTASYATALKDSKFDGGTVSVDDKVVTVTFDEGSEISALNITTLSAQVRVDSITVTYITK